MGKRGAPVGNQNGLKHGFYSKALTETENLHIEEAKVIDRLDDELALLRVKLFRLLENNPDRIDLHFKAVGMIDKIIRTQHETTPKDRRKSNEEMGNVLREVATSLGLEVTD